MAYLPKRDPLGPCAVELVIAIVGGKWKARILESLEEKEKTFAELKRSLPGVTQQVLATQLRGLEKDRIVQREPTINERGPCSLYSLAERGMSLMPVLHVVAAWGTEELRKAGVEIEAKV
jgi:DNA-binding HxlR family transcriptional regulator